MSREDLSELDETLIEEIWTEMLIAWINSCVAPDRKIDTLDPESLCIIINKYRDDVYGDLRGKDLVPEQLEDFIGNTYPGLRIRNLGKTDASKKWYMIASALLYYCCTQSSTGAVDHDICQKLDKDNQEMILKFCEQLPDDKVSIENVEYCIREACRPIYGVQKQYQHTTEHIVSGRPNLGNWSKYSSDDVSSFTSESTKSNIFKPNTMLYSESSDYSKSLEISDTYHGSVLGEKVREQEKITASRTAYPVSCQSSKCVEPPAHRPKTGLIGVATKGLVPSELSQKFRVIEPIHEVAPMKFTDVFAKAGTSEITHKHKPADPTVQSPKGTFSPDYTRASSPKAPVKRPSGVKEKRENQERVTGFQYESTDKQKSKGTVPANLNVGKKRHPSKSPERYSRPVIVERSQVELQPPDDQNVYVTGKYLRTANEPASIVHIENPTKARELSHQSILRKPKYHEDSSPPYLKPRFEVTPALSRSVDSLARFAPSVGTDPSPSAKASLGAANAAQALFDGFSSHRDHESVKEKVEKRVRLTENQELTKKFASECRGCLAPSASGASKKMKNRSVFRFASVVGSKSSVSSPKMKKKPKESEDSKSISKEGSNIKKDVQPVQDDGPSSTLGRRPRRTTMQLFLDNSVACSCCVLVILIVGFVVLSLFRNHLTSSHRRAMDDPDSADRLARSEDDWDLTDSIPIPISSTHFAWICKNNVCVKQTKSDVKKHNTVFFSLSRCTLLCMGHQIWPVPIGEMDFSSDLIAITTEKLEYKFKTVPSDAVVKYVSKAFKLFLLDLAKLENQGHKKRAYTDMPLTKLVVAFSVFTDQDPSLRLDTDETYTIKLETKNSSATYVDIYAESFCGLRNGLETLSQLIMRDEKTGFLITYTASSIKDGPSYRYRGLMLDTARNYFPVASIIRTIDAMAMCKLNTLHWRISDATSFPLFLESMPRMMEYGAYAGDMVYDRNDVLEIVDRAKVRGIRVVIEVAIPGPVGRPWFWTGNTRCPSKDSNNSCDMLCLRLEMDTASFDILESIYRDILSMTNVRDVFHLSNGLFSLLNCPNLLEDRDGFLEKAVHRLKIANRGFIPKLPIVWLTPQLLNQYDAESWAKYGVQLHDLSDIQSEKVLAKFRVVYSAKWDLSCYMKKMRCHKFKTWQEMYKWNSWRTLNVFTLEGGEAILWSDLVSPSGLDDILWPRAAAVAERLWSDIVLDTHVIAPKVYYRLDMHRWRMLLRGINAHPVWPLWCSFNPESCMAQVKPRTA